MSASQIERDIEAIFDYLMSLDGPFEGTSGDLCRAVGISYDGFWSAANRIRSANFVADNGWTIPYVPKGTARKLWQIADGRDDVEAIQDGSKVRGPEVVEYLRRLLAQLDLSGDLADARTKEGRYARYVRTMVAGMVAAGEQVYDGAGV